MCTLLLRAYLYVYFLVCECIVLTVLKHRNEDEESLYNVKRQKVGEEKSRRKYTLLTGKLDYGKRKRKTLLRPFERAGKRDRVVRKMIRIIIWKNTI